LLALATGQGALYNLWLAVMMAAVWAVQRLTKREIGMAIGDRHSYFVALAYAVAIIGCVALGAWAAQLIDLNNYAAATVFRRLSLNLLVTFALALVTEEGFFRGALWASCERAGFSPAKTLVWTSLAFGLWHFAVPIIDPDFAQPLGKVPQYVIGSTVFGIAMGLLRLRSGSIIVTSLCHALWNASVYTFFGAGEKIGQLGIADPSIWDPERGYAGLVLAVLAAVLLWWWIKPSTAPIRPEDRLNAFSQTR
jgi:membrane protease YdiL (CAAX protease family)